MNHQALVKTFTLFVFLILPYLTSGIVAAEETLDARDKSGRDKVINMVKAETPPIIDGVRDAIWDQAALIDDLHQVSPTEFAEPSEKTVIRVMYDEDFLYVSGMMYHKDPKDIVANKLIQGTPLRDEDKLRVYINPFNDGRSGYLFQLNPNGVRHEAIFENVRSRNFAWDGIFYSGAKRTDYGWFGEIAIPYKSISFDPNSSSWGISFLRAIQSNKEDVGWTSYNRQINPTSFGTAVGLEGLNQGVGLDIIPGASISASEAYSPSSSDTNFEPSLDVFYKFTPNLTGALTFNSDFSATSVDNRQVQLTRFSLFFPEQRKFFLQEADIFEFGGLESNGKPFFSRRIGLGPSGEQLDLDLGGKLTGRIGDWNVGALAVQQSGNADTLLPGGTLISDSELFVARASLNILEQSSIGAIATLGNPRSDVDNSLIGFDFNYLNTRTFENRTLEGQLWYQQSDTDGLSGNDDSWGATIGAPNSVGFKGKLAHTYIGENFLPALGFVNRSGIKETELVIGHTKRFEPNSNIRSLDHFIRFTHITDTDGNVESEELKLVLAKAQNQQGDELELYYSDFREVLTSSFNIASNTTIPVGDYSFDRVGLKLETGGQRKIAMALKLEGGDFYSGERNTIGTTITWQPSKHFSGALEYEYNDIDLQQGRFNTQLVNLQTDIAFNEAWAWLTTTQYDNQSDQLAINSRLQWIPKDGQEIYLIYNGGWIDDLDRGFEKVGQSATAKVSYTFRY